LGFWDAVKLCFAKYANFEGRATRPEYWYFFLFNILLSAAAGFLDGATHMKIFQTVESLALVIPSLSVSSRRLHDIGRSGWWQLISLTGIGVILLIYWFCQPSEPGSNKYGADYNRY